MSLAVVAYVNCSRFCSVTDTSPYDARVSVPENPTKSKSYAAPGDVNHEVRRHPIILGAYSGGTLQMGGLPSESRGGVAQPGALEEPLRHLEPILGLEQFCGFHLPLDLLPVLDPNHARATFGSTRSDSSGESQRLQHGHARLVAEGTRSCYRPGDVYLRCSWHEAAQPHSVAFLV